MLRPRHLLVTTCMTGAHIYRLAFGLYVKLIQKENNKNTRLVWFLLPPEVQWDMNKIPKCTPVAAVLENPSVISSFLNCKDSRQTTHSQLTAADFKSNRVWLPAFPLAAIL